MNKIREICGQPTVVLLMLTNYSVKIVSNRLVCEISWASGHSIRASNFTVANWSHFLEVQPLGCDYGKAKPLFWRWAVMFRLGMSARRQAVSERAMILQH